MAGGVAGWLATALVSAMVGLVVGVALVLVLHRGLVPLYRALTARG
jgi:hypothetical protein